MAIALRILLIVLSGLLIARDMGTATQSIQIEIAEEASSTQNAIYVLQQAVVKKITRHVTFLTKFSHYKSLELTPFIAFQTTENLWLRHGVLLI